MQSIYVTATEKLKFDYKIEPNYVQKFCKDIISEMPQPLQQEANQKGYRLRKIEKEAGRYVEEYNLEILGQSETMATYIRHNGPFVVFVRE